MNARMPTPTAEVLLEHTEFVRALARSLLCDEHEADDVAQETFLAALRRPPRPGNLRAWLGKVARNLSLTVRRDAARRRRRERRAARPERLPAADEGVARLELQRRVVDAVLALKEPYRSVIVHRFFYGHGVGETARLLGIPRETVRTRQRRALERLRTCLDEDYERSTWSLALLPLAAPHPGSSTWIKGALAMTSKLKIAAIVVISALAWLTLSMQAAKGTDRRSPRSVTSPAKQAELPAGEPVRAPEYAAIDFSKVDRDRDIFGTVVDEVGRPIGAAGVTALRRPLRGATQLSLTEARVEGPSTHTAPDGTFVLRLTRGEEVMLRVRAAAYAPLLRRWCAAGGRVRIVMWRAGATLEVRAADESGEPVAAVHVKLGGPRGPWGDPAAARGVTDQEGRYLFRDLLASKGRALFAWHPRFGVEPSPRVDVPGRIEVRVVPGRAITGYVIDRTTRAPVVGATVSSSSVLYSKAVTTAADGRFVYDGWSSEGHGSGSLYAWADDYAIAHADVGGKARVDFLLEKGDRATGRVRTTDGAAVAGAFVSAIASRSSAGQQQIDQRETWTNSSGTFVLRGLRRDLPHTLVVQRPGGVRFLLDFDAVPNAPGTVDLGEIVLPAGRRIEGRVLAADGHPLAGVQVELRGANRGRNRLRAEPAQTDYGMEFARRTDDLGRFRFKEIAPGRYGLIARAADGRQLARAIAVDTDVIDLDLRFPTGNEIPVRIVDESGHGVEGVVVSVRTSSQKTDEQGRATLRLPAGWERTLVSVRPPADRFGTVGFYYQRGQGERLVVLRRTAATIEGRILAPDGRPLAGARVLAITRDGFRASTQAAHNGHFVVRVPAGTPVDLKLSGEVFGQWRPLVGALANVAPGNKSVELRARAIATDRQLRIRVVAPDGTGVEQVGFWFRLVGVQFRLRVAPSTPRDTLFTDKAGRLDVAALPALDVVVIMLPNGEIERRWASPKTTSVRVMPDGQEVVFALREPNPIRGVVVLPDGTGTSAVVAAYRGNDLVEQATSETDGSFTLNVAAEETDPVRLQVHHHPGTGGTETLFARLEGVRPGADGVRVELKRQE